MGSTIDIRTFEQIKASGDLPSPKGSALAIIRLTRQDDVSLAELTRVIKTDPAFVGRLIKAANGATVGGRRKIASVQDALTVLGLPAVRNMALGFSLLSSLRSGACKAFDYDAYWSGALLTAVALQAVAQRIRTVPPDEMFCLGLLSRIGELALATIYPDAYGELLTLLSASDDGDLAASERTAFAMDHRELTAAMLADWGLPRLFVEAAALFEVPERAQWPADSRQRQILDALRLADAIRQTCLADPSGRAERVAWLYPLGERLGIDPDGVNALCDGAIESWVDWARLLKMPAQALPPMTTPVPAMGPRSTSGAAAEAAKSPSMVAASRLRVLVVDADPAVRGLLRGMLERAGHDVFEADCGRQGMELALEVQPQMMLVDAGVVEIDGLSLTRALRQTRIGRGIYILVLTEHGDDECLIEAFDNGADDYVTKPVRPRLLAARLRAGHRVIRLQQEVEHDREEIRRFAAELAVKNRRLEEAAMTDPLTGFPNRRYAIERMQQAWASAQRSGRPLCAMVIDIDAFKQINDTHGHDVGDQVLCQISAAIKHALRAPDMVARTGGDEFLVLCPETDLEAALHCGERVRQAVRAARVSAGEVVLSLSISAGVAQSEAHMPDPDALIKVADQGAYLAKAQGRNRVASVQSGVCADAIRQGLAGQHVGMKGTQVYADGAVSPTVLNERG
ncbi:GGDEF domain-containing response regulator [Denitromonas iodatirespirans]|uniref:diguanylate cyclase n=1 Tax=Denitromonas iodatirespirans TaxID=2795389 RepID=A0A944DEG1_DENI1|nr:diguanylate cyclase [Denitromonas iodatirespirans]MBT0963546.1 diguanylate cyclase [Denitromonas iodatirespirans]